MGMGGGGQKICLETCFKSLKNSFTDRPTIFRIEYIFKNAFNFITNGLIRYIYRSRDSSIGVALAYGLYGWGSIPGRGKIFLFSIGAKSALRPTQIPMQWELGVTSQGVKQPGHETDHSLPTSTEVKNGGAIPPLPLCLHGRVLN
jgi:hypothetical protein